MSNYCNPYVDSMDSFKNSIMVQLGYPLVRVELTEEMLEICINEAIETFTEYCINEREYISFNLEDYNPLSGGFTLPSNVVSVFALEDTITTGGSTSAGSVSQLFSISNTMWNAGVWPDFSRTMASNSQGAWVSYDLALQYIKQVRYLTGKGFTFVFNEKSHKLSLNPEPNILQQKGYICLGCNVIRQDSLQMGEPLVRRLALAKAKKILGTVRGKYSNTQLLAGGTINAEIKGEGIEEENKVLEELKAKFSAAPIFFVG